MVTGPICRHNEACRQQKSDYDDSYGLPFSVRELTVLKAVPRASQTQFVQTTLFMPPSPSNSADQAHSAGQVFLVGAGPGDPGLLTLHGARRLGQADIVLYDYLASDLLLDHAPADAVRICLGRHGVGKIWTQEEINERMVSEALAGKMVVRLKGGDPGVFGRLAEEIAACQSAGVSYEIVPGVTTAVAAGAYAGVTITDRDRASCVAFVTGHERAGKEASEQLDFTLLAKFPGTLVVYMAVTHAADWSQSLMDGGKSPDTPVALVRRCSLPDQTTIDCTLGTVAKVLAPGAVRPPLVAIVGEVAAREVIEGKVATDWFAARPLFGKTVLVTRPRQQAASLIERFTELGARVLVQPAIEIGPPDTWTAVDKAIDHLSDFDYVVFSSRNGVEAFLGRLYERGVDARQFGSAKIAAVGPATTEALATWRLRTDLQPKEYQAEALAEALLPDISGKRVLLVRASRGREVLSEKLSVAGAQVEQVVAYESRDVTEVDATILAELRAGQIDWVTATSSATASSLLRLFGTDLSGAQIAAISPLTAAVLEKAGLPAMVVAAEFTAEGLVEAILAKTVR